MRLTKHTKDSGLNPDQKRLFEQLEEFLADDEYPIFLMKGYAGTGKSFVTSVLTSYMEDVGREFVLMAPTGKAARVLSDKCKLQVSTIHGGLYSCVDELEKKGKENAYKIKTTGYLNQNSSSDDAIFIIDESSMVSDRDGKQESMHFGSGMLLKDLLRYIDIKAFPKRKIIFIGDAMQLPPVGMNSSPALSAEYFSEKYGLRSMEYELTQVVRQKSDNEAMTLLTELRLGQINPGISFPAAQNGANVIPSIPINELQETYFNLCEGSIDLAENIAVIAQTNKDVKGYNYQLRQVFFPSSERVSPNEKVVNATRYSTGHYSIPNGEFGVVTEVLSQIEHRPVFIERFDDWEGMIVTSIDLEFIDVVVQFHDADGNLRSFQTKVILNALTGSTPHLSELEEQALIQDFKIRHPDINPYSSEFKELMRQDVYYSSLRLNYGYAFTCYKAQGGEWPIVIVDGVVRIQCNKSKCSWLYTAISRTNDQLFVIDHVNDKTFYIW